MNRRDFNKSAVSAGLLVFPALGFARKSPVAPSQIIRRASERGVANHGWLESRHSFSFADYFDPAWQGFSDLRVINEDRVQAGRGFGKHPHRDMEIFSYVLDGQLEHRDSMGNGSIITQEDVQIMSAGRGVAHSEFNPSPTESVHFLQIWLQTNAPSAEPTYQQKKVPLAEKRGRLRLILSEKGDAGSLRIRQDVRVYAGLFDGAEGAKLALAPGRATYVQVARGELQVNGELLKAGDGLMAKNLAYLSLTNGNAAEVLVFDLRGQLA